MGVKSQWSGGRLGLQPKVRVGKARSTIHGPASFGRRLTPAPPVDRQTSDENRKISANYSSCLVSSN